MGLLACLVAAEEPAKPSAAALERIKTHGFAVCSERPLWLHTIYRFDQHNPLFVTADSALGAYCAMLRRSVDDLAFDLGRDLPAQITAWREALGEAAPEPARFYVGVLDELCKDGRDGGTPASVEALRLTGEIGGSDRGGVHYARTHSFWADPGLPHAGRFLITVYWLTRADVRGGRELLQKTIPKELRERVDGFLAVLGTIDARFPGTNRFYDVEVPGDHRFEGINAPAHRQLVGLDRARHLGSALAAELLKNAPGLKPWEPVRTGALYEAFMGVCRALPAGTGAPPLFRTHAWRAVEMQTVLASDVLYRVAVGPASSSTEYLGHPDVPGFVHPQPRFWTALAKLARDTPGAFRRLGHRGGLPTDEEIDAAMREVEACLATEKRIPARCIAILGRVVYDPVMLHYMRHYGKSQPKHNEVKERLARIFRDLKARWLSSWKRSRQRDRKAGAAGGGFDELAYLCDGFAKVAQRQLDGRDVGEFREWFKRYGVMLNRAVAPFRHDPMVVGVVGFRDRDTVLVQGCGPVDELWIEYPYRGEKVLCRGALLSYRELVAKRGLFAPAWRESVESGAAKRPRWTALFR